MSDFYGDRRPWLVIVALAPLAACPAPQIAPQVAPQPSATSPSRGPDDQYAACKEQEKLGDAATCWKKWLVDNGDEAGDSPQRDYAKMYITHRPDHRGILDSAQIEASPMKVLPLDPEQEKRGVPIRGASSVQWPEQTVGDRECWDQMRTTRKHVDDYDALVARCGRPTGMLAFSKLQQGELGPDHKADVYTIKVLGGGCYRIFVAADEGVKELDLAFATMDNRIVWSDKSSQSVAVLQWDKALCVDADVQFKLVVALKGAGRGAYGVGVWVRPKE